MDDSFTQSACTQPQLALPCLPSERASPGSRLRSSGPKTCWQMVWPPLFLDSSKTASKRLKNASKDLKRPLKALHDLKRP